MKQRLFAWIAIFWPVILTGCAHPVEESAYDAGDGRPNVLLIVVDDLGQTDIGALGGEIPTPNLDALVREGTLLTDFYAAPTCSPTRAMLLTGVDNHLAGYGNMYELMAPNQKGRPGYEGYLNQRVVTIAELLGADGYRTLMAGKWHLGTEPDHDPSARGFQHSFAMLLGGASHYADMIGQTIDQPKAIYRRDGKGIESLPEDFYSTTAYTDEIIDYIDEGGGTGKPFFAYLAYTAPHWPLQAPQDLVDLFKGKYDAGYEELRKARFQSQKAKGLIPQDAPMPDFVEAKPWDSLTADEKAVQARKMEVYAAMVLALDQGIGRVLDHLRATDELENTIVIFMSDNGPEGTTFGHPLFSTFVPQFDNRLENIGKEGSFVGYGPGWAEAAASTFRGFKSYASEGGIRVPAIVRMPQGFPRGNRNSEVLSVSDVTPTILQATGTNWRALGRQKNAVHRPTGNSFFSLLADPTTDENATQRQHVMELFGRRAVRQGAWKAVRQDPPMGKAEWQLFNVASDPGETRDMALSNPEKLEELLEAYLIYEISNTLIYPQGRSGY